MSLRVIAGEYRGRRLDSLEGRATRPLLGQVREALFNILGDQVEDAEVWDLFAGTGASGIEALSRGARRVLFLEKGGRALSVLKRNLDALGEDAQQRSQVFRVDAWQPPVLRPEGEMEEQRPGIILFDPPYPDVVADPLRSVERVRALTDRLRPDGGVLCFHFPDKVLEENDFGPQLDVDLRRWGGSAMALLRPTD